MYDTIIERSQHGDEIYCHSFCVCDECEERCYRNADESYEMERDEEAVQ